MQLIEATLETHLPKSYHLCIGNFDGVHPGHQQLIAHAQRKGQSTAVLCFEPFPREFFGAPPPYRLMSKEQRRRCLAELGVEATIELQFSRGLAATEGRDFVNNFILKQCHPLSLTVGYDFCFGKGRLATAQDLLNWAKPTPVTIVEPIIGADSLPVSSTKIRESIRSGDLQTALQLLGHPFVIEGRVEHGLKNGRRLGFPTANLRLDPRQIHLANGVYAGRVFPGRGQLLRYSSETWPAVANFGRRPSIKEADGRLLLEIHILDKTDLDLYEQDLSFYPLYRLRHEQSFSDVSLLQAQIALDIARARSELSST